jgi:hypothetical protein
MRLCRQGPGLAVTVLLNACAAAAAAAARSKSVIKCLPGRRPPRTSLSPASLSPGVPLAWRPSRRAYLSPGIPLRARISPRVPLPGRPSPRADLSPGVTNQQIGRDARPAAARRGAMSGAGRARRRRGGRLGGAGRATDRLRREGGRRHPVRRRAARPAAARRGAMSGTVTVAVLPLLPTRTKFQVYSEDLRRCRRRAAGPGSAAAGQSPRQAPAVPLPPSTGTRPPHTPCTPPLP